ncbi:MAG: type I restriction endonuclease subunit R [Alphaproteobacteria bacterium]
MGGEWTFAEKPCLDYLQSIGYDYLHHKAHADNREADNHVIFKPILIEALMRINGITEADALAVYQELLGKADNEEWTKLLRGDYSRNVEGHDTKQTIRLIDFLDTKNNTFTVTNQLKVKAEKSRIPDVVVYINGIPVVVIEAKSPLNWKNKTGEAFAQIQQYERDIPRLFYSNQFNILTDGTNCLYGSTGSPSKFFGTWKDPWPRKVDEFGSALEQGLWSLLEPSRLLDLIAHFIVFEREDGRVIKKMCRYQQFRAVNKIVHRVADEDKRRGLVWHTQGSGKSLTMVFAALKLKKNMTVDSPALANPSIMVLTDRVDLDDQISGTFEACGLPNPERMKAVKDLRALLSAQTEGLMVLSTVFKFQGSNKAIENSGNWIVLVDECHRTQEKDLGAYIRATLPDAQFFGFTGTPIKKTDKDTYANFGVEGEGYLDKYGIDDAVADGATVPIHYTGRKTDWHIDEAQIDILFDQWFAELPDEELEQLKRKGVRLAHLVKHPKRVELVTLDLWTHYKAYAKPDGFKAQIVAYDREAIVLYKRALTALVASELRAEGMNEAEALAEADRYAVCVYSQSQEDDKPDEDSYVEDVRQELKQHYLDKDAETNAKAAFKRRGEPPYFLIVCDKLLTGFDAPLENVMYLDKPLKEHNLLQAIARTNRVDTPEKRNGLIVDYIGVSKNLDTALESYREDDVKNAMRPLDDLLSALRGAHAEVMSEVKPFKGKGASIKDEIDGYLNSITGQKDKWYTFRRKAREFIAAYEALSPEPSTLEFLADLKWVDQCLRYGAQVMEQKESLDHFEYSRKIRDMLEEHVLATGLSTTIKLRHITDPDFWEDFNAADKAPADLREACIRKSTELRKITSERIDKNPIRYGKFSDKLREIIKRLEKDQANLAQELKAMEGLSKAVDDEDNAHEGSDMSAAAYDVYKILKELGEGANDNGLQELAQQINELYACDQSAPRLWQEKDQLKKSLRGEVRVKLHAAGIPDIKNVAEQVEEFAIKHHAKV